MEYPIIIKDVLPMSYYHSLNDELISNWELTNFSYKGGSKSWGISDHLKNGIAFLDASVVVKMKIKKILREKIRLCKIHVNGQTSCQNADFHVDFDDDNIWTFVLFCGYNWNTSWSGEFVCQNKNNGEYRYVPFIPNTGALIPSNWQHYGMSPNTLTDSLRKTVAFSYCYPEYFEKLLKTNKKAHLFY